MITIEQNTLGEIFQSLFVNLRTKTYAEVDQRQIADFCDGAEYLAGLVARPEDKTESFRRYLKGMVERHHCSEALRIFEESM